MVECKSIFQNFGRME